MTNSLIAQNLINSLLVRGITLEISADTNKIRAAPATELTSNDRHWITELKPELVEVIRAGLNTVRTLPDFRRVTGLNLRIENGRILVAPSNQVTTVIGNWIAAKRDYVAAMLAEDQKISTWLSSQGFNPESIYNVLADNAARGLHYWQSVDAVV